HWIYQNPKIFYNAFAWIYDPRRPVGKQNWPFILRPKQVKVVDLIKEAIDEQFSIGINKSRDEGATELVIKFLTCYSLLVPDVAFLMGSEKEDKIEKTGDRLTLFAKVDHTLSCLPFWWKPKFIDN
ncbi:unnamed protein product, partial [marine sediment metagenome]